MNPMLNIAIRAARKAGNVIAKNYERRDDIQTSKKGINDYVTSVDKAAEAEIIEIIQKSYPDHTIISEERGALEGKDSDIQWVIDPLDGTTNFVKGLPHFSVSIAIRVKNRTEVGVVYDPIRNELFTAVRGEGAKLNEVRLRVDSQNELNGAILATGFPFKQPSLMPTQFAIMNNLIDEAADALVLRPLITHDKEQIIAMAKEIGTDDIAKSMPEFCGVLSKNPTIKAVREKILEEENNFDFGMLESEVENAQYLDIRQIEEETEKEVVEVDTI